MAVEIKNLGIVRQGFANAAFSHKTQELAAERKQLKSNIFKAVNIFLVSLILGLLVAQVANPNNITFSYLGAGFTATEIILMLISLSFNIESEIVTHKNSALKFMDLRDRYKLLISDILNSQIKTSIIVSRRDELLHAYQTLSALALPTNQKDYVKAMRRLKIKEDRQNVWSDKQINSLLPLEIRSKK